MAFNNGSLRTDGKWSSTTSPAHAIAPKFHPTDSDEMKSAPAGGHFKGAAQGQDYAHNHASQMAHAANRRLAVAKALSGGGGSVAPVAPAAPSGGAPAAPSGGAPAAPSGGANFKSSILQAAAMHGVQAAPQHVHNAIDSLTQRGGLTPYQGHALKQHSGPLVGPAGQQTMAKITNELVSNPAVRRGM